MTGSPGSSAVEAGVSSLAGLFARLDASFEAGGAPATADLVLGRARLRVEMGDSAAADLLEPAFSHIIAEPEGRPRAKIRIWSGEQAALAARTVAIELGGGHPEAALRESHHRHGDALISVQPGSGLLSVADAGRARGWVAIPDPAALAWWERAAPLRTVLHWLTSAPDRGLVHGAAVAPAGCPAVLLAGPGGSGKSTLAVVALGAGFDYLGDDYVLADAGDGSVHSVFATAKLHPRSFAWAPELEATATPPDDADDGKAVVALGTVRPKGLRRSAPLGAIVCPRLVPGATAALEPLRAGAAVLALAPSTTFQMPDRWNGALGLAAKLARSADCFRLTVGDDPGEAVALLGEAARA